jgi:hypothetical protein
LTAFVGCDIRADVDKAKKAVVATESLMKEIRLHVMPSPVPAMLDTVRTRIDAMANSCAELRNHDSGITKLKKLTAEGAQTAKEVWQRDRDTYQSKFKGLGIPGCLGKLYAYCCMATLSNPTAANVQYSLVTRTSEPPTIGDTKGHRSYWSQPRSVPFVLQAAVTERANMWVWGNVRWSMRGC